MHDCILNNFKNGFVNMFAHQFVGGLLAPFMPDFGFYNQYNNPYSSYMGSCFSFTQPQSNFFPQDFFNLNTYNMSYQQSIWGMPSFSPTPSSYSFNNIPSYNFGFSDSFTDFYNDLDFGLSTKSSSKTEPKTETKTEPKTKKGTKVTTDAKELAEKWQKFKPKAKNITKEFCQKVIDISKEVGCTPDDLMTVINLETAGTFSPSVQNKNTKATGLIQFMPNTAKNMGTSVEKLAKMSAIEQLDYVKRYLIDGKNTRKITGSIDATTLYCLIFWPAAANKEDSFVIAKNNTNKAEDTYDLNKGLDKNKDNVITRGDLRARVTEFMA